jgi:hypothetical protein
MLTITPKTTILNDPDRVREHRGIVDSKQFSESATITLAELARMNLSAEQMAGANLFLDTFLSLAEKEQERKPFPHKTLSQ